MCHCNLREKVTIQSKKKVRLIQSYYIISVNTIERDSVVVKRKDI